MAHKISTASDIEVGSWLTLDGKFTQVTDIMDIPATDVEGASRYITHSHGMLAVYASEPIKVQV